MDGVTVVVEAATATGSAAVFRDGHLVAEREIAMRGITEERLMPAVVACLEAVDVPPGATTALRRVVCGAGPGSFTSLRIAAGIAKGLCAGAARPLYAVSSLALAVPALAPGRFVVTLDALRGEWYAAVFDWDGTRVQQREPPHRCSTDAVAALAAAHTAAIVEAAPRAGLAAPLLADALAAGPVDLGAWEPAYGRLAEAQVKWEAAHDRPLAR